MLALLTSKIGASALKYAAIALAIGALFLWGRHYQLKTQQDAVRLDQAQVQHLQDQTNIAAMQAQYAAYQAAQAQVAAEQKSQAARVAAITKEIANAPQSTACAQSPAIAALVDGLRKQQAGTNGNPRIAR